MTTSFLNLTGYWKMGDNGLYHLVKTVDHTTGEVQEIYDFEAGNRFSAFLTFIEVVISHLYTPEE